MNMDPDRRNFNFVTIFILAATLILTSTIMSNSAFAQKTDDSILLLRDKKNRNKNRQKRAKPKRSESSSRVKRNQPRRSDRVRRDQASKPERARRNSNQRQGVKKNQPRKPERARRDQPRKPERVRRDQLRKPDRVRRDQPRKPDRVRRDQPRRPDRTRPDRPRTPDRTRPNRPRNFDQARNNRRERERNRVEREQRRRREVRRGERIRDRERRSHRRVSRDRYRQHRHNHRFPRRTIRHHYRWSVRYNSWWFNIGRWGHPGWPHTRIYYPAIWPNTNITWSIHHIINVADNLETNYEHLYNTVVRQFGSRSDVATKAFALWHSAQVYSDAVEFYNGRLYLSLYELYNLEERASQFEQSLRRLGSSRDVNSHAKLGQFYINELLWQYRQQIGSIDTWRDRINEGDDWRQEIGGNWEDANESYSTKSFYFWWDKPHRKAEWQLRTPATVSSISLEATNTKGQVGKNGVAGVSEIILNYTDGSSANIVSRSHPSYSERSGQLVLSEQGGFMEVYNPNPNLRVRSIEMKADSWVAPDVDVEIQFSINSFDRNSFIDLH